MITVLFATIIVIALIALLVCTFIIVRKIDALRDEKNKDQTAQLMNQNLQAMHERLDKAAHYIGSLKQELGSFQSIGQNISDLREAFFSPKLRGNFGEQVLYDALSNNFPHDHYETQHKFKDGQTVDAVIKTKDGLIPVDSKFPIDNFRKMSVAGPGPERESERNEFYKAVRKHITDIAKKYILPEEGTINYAIMYVPSEAIYYEIISGSDEMAALAGKNKILMVSPNSFAYLLQILRMGFERIKIEENAQKVWDLLTGIQQESAKFSENLGILARHVSQAKSSMDSISADFGKLSSKIDQAKLLK